MFHFLGRKNNHLGKKHQTELTDDGRYRQSRVEGGRGRRRERGGRGRPPTDCIVTLSIVVMPDTCHLEESALRRRAVGRCRLPKNERASEPTAAEGEAD